MIGVLILVLLCVATAYVAYANTIGSKRDYDKQVRDRGGPDPRWDAFCGVRPQDPSEGQT